MDVISTSSESNYFESLFSVFLICIHMMAKKEILLLIFSISTFSCRAQSWPFYFGLILPFGLIYIFNTVVFIIIIVNFIRRPNVQKEAAGKFKKLKENFWLTIGLSILLGVSWIFGLLATAGLPNYIRIPFDIVFSVLASFQGVFLFLLYCARSPECRKLWKNWMLCRFTKRSQSPVPASGSNHTRSATAMSSGNVLSRFCSRVASMNQCFASLFRRKQNSLTSADFSNSVKPPPPMPTSPIELVRKDTAMLGQYEDEIAEKITFECQYSVNNVFCDDHPSKEGTMIENPMVANVKDEISTYL